MKLRILPTAFFARVLGSPVIAAAGEDDWVLLELARSGVTKNSSAFYNIHVENTYSAIWRRYGASGAAPVVLENGPGANIAQGVAFAMRGAKKYFALDIHRDAKFYEPAAYESVACVLATVSPGTVRTKAEHVFTIADGKARFNPERMEHLYPHQSYDIPLPDNSVDYGFSNAAFEHIADPEATIKALRRVLKPGGITAHQIDMRDHGDFSKPLEFLKHDATEWKRRSAKKPAHLHMNRWRLSEFHAAFERNGFEVLAMDVNARYPVTEEFRDTLHPDFRKLPLAELSAVAAMFVARKR